MQNLNNKNINDPQYWDDVYKKERGSGKQRIDNERADFLIGAIQDWEQRNVYIPKPYKLLDVGCGDGEMLRKVHTRLPEWSKNGIDIVNDTINWAKTIDPHFHYQISTAYDLPYAADEMSVVFCGETLEHLENPEKAVEEMFRVLMPGGYLVCSIPLNHNNYSPEHLNEFTVWDAINLTTKGDVKKLVNIDVKCGGISIIWTTIK